MQQGLISTQDYNRLQKILIWDQLNITTARNLIAAIIERKRKDA